MTPSGEWDTRPLSPGGGGNLHSAQKAEVWSGMQTGPNEIALVRHSLLGLQ
jgi:hypothetical protein